LQEKKEDKNFPFVFLVNDFYEFHWKLQEEINQKFRAIKVQVGLINRLEEEGSGHEACEM
jgi:hypothetical protein